MAGVIRSLHEGEQLVRRILDAVPGGVVHVDRDGALRSANAEALRLLGVRSADEIAKRHISDWGSHTINEDGSPCPPSDYPATQALATGMDSGPRTIGIRHADGELVWAVVRAVPLHDAEGNVDGVVATFVEITGRKRAEEELRRSEEKWRLLAENLPDFVVLVDTRGTFLQVNRVVPETTEEQVLGTCVFDYVEESDREEYRRRFDEVVTKRERAWLVTRATGRKSKVVWYESTFVPIVEHGRVERVLIVARDMTERKQAEDALRASEQKWRALVDSLPDDVLVLDRERRVLSSNNLGGYRSEEVLGRVSDDFIDESMRDDWRRQFETALETGESVRFDVCVRTSSEQPSWYETILVPLKENGSVERVMVLARDISGRRAMLASLAEKERLASVGMVAASVAHEIMNPLTYVLANLEFAMGDRVLEERGRSKALAEAREGAKRMQQIVWDLRSLGRAGGEELFYVDARSVLETALRLSGPEVARTARVVLDLQEVPGVLASESRLCQVFINLLVNAAQSMEDRPPPEREIHVRARHDELANMVAVDITDTGIGIASTGLDRIFEPFYTTKRSGTGLGLSISRDIVGRMGGRIEVESTLGRGTTFTVWLSTTRERISTAKSAS